MSIGRKGSSREALPATATAARTHARLATPLEWTFTRRDLEALLTKLDDRKPRGDRIEYVTVVAKRCT